MSRVNLWRTPGPWTELQIRENGDLHRIKVWDHCPGPVEVSNDTWNVLAVQPGLVLIEHRTPGKAFSPGYRWALYVANSR